MKMNLKLVALCAALVVIAMVMTACGEQTVAVAPTPDPTPEVTEPVVTEPEVTEPEVEPEPEIVEPEEPKEDPLEFLRMTPEIAQKEQGFFLLRDGRFYTLNSRIKNKMPGVKYLPGAKLVDGSINLYFRDGGSKQVASYGYIPVVTLEEGDEIIVFSNEKETLDLFPAEFLGYSHDIRQRGGSDYSFYDLETDNYYKVSGEDYKTLEIRDEEGNKKTGYLEKDVEYTISWYQGTQYNEVVLEPLHAMYEYSTPCIRLEWELTKEGYARYDLTSIPSGLYLIDSTPIIIP